MNTNLKIAVRNILNNKIQSSISIFGLGIGLGCIILLAMLYIHESSYDSYISDNQDLYRVIQGDDCRTSYPLANAIKAEFPVVDTFFRYYQTSEIELKSHNNEIVKDKLFAFSDASIYPCLGIDFKQGIAAQLPTEIAISEKTSAKYFDNHDVIGKVLLVRLNEKFIPLTISGVYEDFPSNSTLSPEFIANIDLIGEILNHEQKALGQYSSKVDEFKTWGNEIFYTYLRLKASANPDVVVKGLQKYKNMSVNEKRKQMAYSLQPVTNIYMKSNNLNGNQFTRLGNAVELNYYIAIAALILLIAAINYIFLTRARINSRLKELGAKKVVGASRNSIQRQIVLESNLISFLSLFPASIVIFAGMPFIDKTLDLTLNFEVFHNWRTLPVIISIVMLTGSLSGLIIGSRVSRISTLSLLNGKSSKNKKYNSWNNSFLSVHFTIFIILIVGVFILRKQINYALTNFKAIDPSNILICELNSSELSAKMPVIKNEIDKLSGTITSAASSFIPPFNNYLPVKLQYEGEKVTFDGIIMGKGMVSLLGLQVISGEDFDEFHSERRDVIFNESAASKYKLKAGDTFNGFYIKGIVKDFTAHSMHKLIQPMVIIQQDPEQMSLFAIKTNGIDDPALIKTLYRLLKVISPDKIVKTYYLTDQINQFYEHEQNQAKLFGAFSLLALILSVIGLIGITYNTISRRTKEIGIRKVNGAKVSEILAMLNKGFIKWVAIAFVIASPIAWYVMNKWLQNFAYKTELSWWVFALAGLITLVIALFTVSIQSWKVASKNPVEALRYE
jgi:putative ABC transport system permease protein